MTRTIEVAGDISLTPLFAKAVASAGVRSGGELPEVQVVRSGVTPKVAEIAQYAQVCEFPLHNHLPATYLHVLTFPLQVTLMADAAFPFPLMGSVHVENTIKQFRRVVVGETLDLTARVENLRPHRRGAQADLIGEVRVGEELVYQGRSTYLFRGQKVPGEQPEKPEETPAVTGQGTFWRLAGDLGRRYAAVSGDVNPIHMYPLGAKALGFPTTIAHGMWSKARMLAAVDSYLPAAYETTVSFRKPVLLPGAVSFVARTGGVDGAIDMALRGTGKRSETLHARGVVHPL